MDKQIDKYTIEDLYKMIDWRCTMFLFSVKRALSLYKVIGACACIPIQEKEFFYSTAIF